MLRHNRSVRLLEVARLVDSSRHAGSPPPSRTRAEDAADTIAAAGRKLAPGTRLGSRDELRVMCGVSVGTLHEALRLLQSTGEVTVRPGPGGGVFVGERSALARLLRDVREPSVTDPDFRQTARILSALAPLLIDDAIAACADHERRRTIEAGLHALSTAPGRRLQNVVRASLEMFATLVSLSSDALLRAIAGYVVRTQIDQLADIDEPVDPHWRPIVDAHLSAVTTMVSAILDGDAGLAIAARSAPGFRELFAAVATGRDRTGHGLGAGSSEPSSASVGTRPPAT